MHNRLAVFDLIFLPDHVCVVGEEEKSEFLRAIEKKTPYPKQNHVKESRDI